MIYHVIISPNAKANLRAYCLHAAQHAPATAARWLDRFESALATLSVEPRRCGLAPENDRVDAEIRQFIFGKGRSIFRALFAIEGDKVHILHIRRAAMDVATPEELFG
ncbi:MAG: type II toxin-antitoxin system RelE/ParE family toxin [Pirellulales bacterium]